MRPAVWAVAWVVAVMSPMAWALNSAEPVGEPGSEPPTLQCLGTYWIVRGDDNQNAKVEVDYRQAGTGQWRPGPDLFRVGRGTQKLQNGQSRLKVPGDAWLFAGSLFLLRPDTEYEIRLTLIDPDGGQAKKTLKARTIIEPVAGPELAMVHVVPGAGGGTGTEADPFKGLAAAEAAVKPGTIVLVHAGTYKGTFTIKNSGEEGRPIVYRGAGDGEAILDGGQPGDGAKEYFAKGTSGPKDNPLAGGNGVEANGVHDVWFERLSFRNAFYLLKAQESFRIVVRRCHFTNGTCGVVANGDQTGNTGRFFIADNVFDGIFPWPTTKQQWRDLPEARAVWIAGYGNVICYNRITYWKDGIDLNQSPYTVGSDIHNNDISEQYDDGAEMDGAERNCRNVNNRYTNVHQGVSVQPIYGGPIYVWRNVLYNIAVEPFKMHNSPAGGLFIHNTVVKKGPPLLLLTSAPVRNCYFRNNLFLGTDGPAYECQPKMTDCDYDYDGFGGFSGKVFIKWNKTLYATPAELRQQGPIERHAVIVDPATAFASGVQPPEDNGKAAPVPDLRLNANSQAVGAAEPLRGLNESAGGRGPSLGAYELAGELPHYGPRPEK